MNGTDTRVMGALAVAAVLVPTILGIGGVWPFWVSVLVAAILLAAIVVVWRASLRRAHSPQHGIQPTGYLSPPATAKVADLALDSAVRGYRFLMSATVSWQPIADTEPVHADPRALAVEAARARAVAITREVPPLAVTEAEYRVAAELGIPRPIPAGGIRVWARDVTVRLPHSDLERLQRIDELRKDDDVWQQERHRERRLRAYLASEVLVTPGNAVVWWLAQNPDKVREAAELVDAFTRLSNTVHGSSLNGDSPGGATPTGPCPAEPGEPADQLVDDLFPDPADPKRVLFVRDLAGLAEEYGRADTATRLRERHGDGDMPTDDAA